MAHSVHYLLTNCCPLSKSNQIRLLATAPLIHSTGAQVQAYNYNANTITINNKSKKNLKIHNAVKMSIVQVSFEIR